MSFLMWITVKAASAPLIESASRGWKLRLFFFFGRPVISTSVLHFLPAYNETCLQQALWSLLQRPWIHNHLRKFSTWQLFLFFPFLGGEVFHWAGVWAAACQIKENKSSLCFPNSWSIFWLQSRTAVQLNALLLSILTNSQLHFLAKCVPHWNPLDLK